MLIHLALPDVGVTVIKPELRSAEPINDPAYERDLAAVAELLADPLGVELEDRVHAGVLEMPQQTGPSASAEHHHVVTVVPALQPIAQLDLERSADVKQI